jgi:KUP system potassium uptake protein
VILILRADNRGEGGALALTALAAQAEQQRPRLRQFLLLLGLFGATLFYGDSIITPAISVLGAVEGLEIATPVLQPYVVPISLVVLVGLFFVQRYGTHLVGKFFGPIIVIWFLILGATGVAQIQQTPDILQALNPWHALSFLLARGPMVLAAVGAIVLALTGAEALYADMGHFGRKPIQLAWAGLVLPALALHYMGQGALLMRDPSAIENPFFRMFPQEALIAAVILATVAAIIASQAVISGAYSMTKQAILLGFLPRMNIRYTSEKEVGQIYMPAVNWALLLGVVLAVLAFKNSSALAGAYGIAVTLTMVIGAYLTAQVHSSSSQFGLSTCVPPRIPPPCRPLQAAATPLPHTLPRQIPQETVRRAPAFRAPGYSRQIVPTLAEECDGFPEFSRDYCADYSPGL